MVFQLAPLPYASNALEPYLSTQTLELHHGKHHQGYVDKLNKLVPGTSYEHSRLEDIIRATYNDQTHSCAGKERCFGERCRTASASASINPGCDRVKNGWGTRDRTWEWWNQNPLPYRLAIPHQCFKKPYSFCGPSFPGAAFAAWPPDYTSTKERRDIRNRAGLERVFQPFANLLFTEIFEE